MTTKMSRLAIILCIVGFFASKTIANAEPQQKPVIPLSDFINQTKNEITQHTLQVFEQIENLGNLQSSYDLKFNHSNGETVGLHIVEIMSIVQNYSSNLTISEQRSRKPECLRQFYKRRANLEGAAKDVFASLWGVLAELLQKKRQSLETLKDLEARVPSCKDDACDRIKNSAQSSKNLYLDNAENVRDFYVKVGNGSAVFDKLFVDAKDQLETYSRQEQQMLERVRTCLIRGKSRRKSHRAMAYAAPGAKKAH